MHTKNIICFIEPFMKPERAADMRTLRRCWLTEMQFSKGEARIVFSHYCGGGSIKFSTWCIKILKNYITIILHKIVQTGES